MKKISLNGIWNGQRVGGDAFKAQVPGCTINDLLENGYLPKDLLSGKNADSVLKYENDDWIYTKKFSLERLFEKMILSIERIDTYADIYLNGIFLGHTENGNIGHTFDVSKAAVTGDNMLEIRLYSPVVYVQDLPKRNGAFTTERLYTRRTQCTYSWDWVARFVCCGIGNTALICYDKQEPVLKNVYIFTQHIESDTASLKIEADFERVFSSSVIFEIVSDEGKQVYKRSVDVSNGICAHSATIEDAHLWYPAGYGKQPLYTLYIKDGDHILHEEKFGIRTVEILEIVDEVESENFKKCLEIKNPKYDLNVEFSSFTLAINGIKIMCKGANWVPCQPYEMSAKEEKISELLELSVEMGLNMLRVWGGGAFECKHFYDECSRLGILVTQDFLMACGTYPEKEQWFLEHLQKESEYACYLMRNQPCLVWYSGDNENAVNGSFDDEDYCGKSAYEKGIKPIVEVLDRNRKAFPSSPYGGNKFASNTVGTTHNTQYLGRFFDYIEGKENLCDYKEELKKYRARFIAEEPVFGAASLSSLRRFMTENEIFSEDMDAWSYHTKGNPGLPKELMEYFIQFTEGVFGKFKNTDDRFFKFKYLAYEWVRVIMEQARREKWFCSGEIFWMLNDCWTAASSWALIDYFNKPKLGYYSFKRCSKPILSSIDYENGKYIFSISNDSLSPYLVKAILYKVKNGVHHRIGEIELNCPANENVQTEIDACIEENEMLIADLKCAANDCRSFYKRGDLQLEKKENAVEFHVENGKVFLYAREYVHAIELEGEAIFDENGFIMLKGERKEVGFRYLRDASQRDISVEAYTISPCSL